MFSIKVFILDVVSRFIESSVLLSQWKVQKTSIIVNQIQPVHDASDTSDASEASDASDASDAGDASHASDASESTG